MRIVCPSCQAAYEVPDTLLNSGQRRVRCAKCGGDWFPEAASPDASEPEDTAPPPRPALPSPPADEPEAEAAAPPPAPPAPAPQAPLAQDPLPRAEERLAPDMAETAGRSLVIVAALAWLVSVAALGAMGWAAVAFRAEVMAAWGASRRVYALLGLG